MHEYTNAAGSPPSGPVGVPFYYFINPQTGIPCTGTQTVSCVITDPTIKYIITYVNSITPPNPNGVNYYPIFFGQNVVVTMGSGQSSCLQFCAYHGTIGTLSSYFTYAVHPSLANAGCNIGCGPGSVLQNTQSVISHELSETVTDPAVGFATTYASPLAWYDPMNGEIADICNGQQATTTVNGGSFTVQKLWSNSRMICTAS